MPAAKMTQQPIAVVLRTDQWLMVAGWLTACPDGLVRAMLASAIQSALEA